MEAFTAAFLPGLCLSTNTELKKGLVIVNTSTLCLILLSPHLCHQPLPHFTAGKLRC